ncbi:mannose-6-phosphate isomerase, class I [Nocardioides panacis]|uniref:Mannose-6-phosphate isomerase, class I n=1 Tax=Nocardioides panacis TaxID=2849501 RepID=A0A975SY38_9ACTN|nr:mannose-6-phosphate isomerase, class I [Nocardioides panacis]QWZ08098.1 mannose-6-phosphate isomerase, class I [Nocardioides panacis]
MHRLTNPVRAYAWGSRTHIPRLCDLPVGDEPMAEMWFGAHPADPSRVEDGRGLDAVIQDSPVSSLGLRTVDTFGPRLPFLMKLLAAAEPLSLQVHPTSERARIRYAEQNAAGIAMDAPERSYQDASHKPELIFALTRFEGMAGFREIAKTVAILRELGLPWLDEIADQLENTPTPFQTLRRVVTALLATSGTKLQGRLQELRTAAADAEARWHRPQPRMRPVAVEPSSLERESLRVFAQTPPLVDRYPDDAGVLVTLLLNHVVLAAGEAMFIDAGVIHAYTSGFGVEIMAASDNVLRAGLTPKHVDIPELLEITNFTPIPPPLWVGSPLRDAEGTVLSPPVSEFELVVGSIDGQEPAAEDVRPMIVLCLEGEVRVAAGKAEETLTPGESVFVEDNDGLARLSGTGRFAIARTPA